MRSRNIELARRARGLGGVALVALAITATGVARAETIGGALVKAYLSSPDINAQRAAVRAADEGLPKANAGYLPTVTASLNGGVSSVQGLPPGLGASANGDETTLPRGY